jgi:hypothetical protein
MRVVLALAALAGAHAAAPEDAVLRPGVPLFDTDGNRLYAGGANLFLDNGVYYLVGEGRKTLPDACSECLNLYSSTDLAAWKFEACVLHNKDVVANTPPNPVYRMERPKIFRCPSNNRLTMWFHCDLTNFGIQSVGVLTADAIAGPWTFAAPCFQPDGRASYDMGTFVDDGPRGDGHAYLVRSVENHFAGISQMSDDCLNVTGIVSQGPDMEGQAIMRDDAGVLHLLGSHLTGWAPNAAQFVTSPNASLVGAVWVDNVNPSGDPTTYDSQSTFIYPFKHADGHTTAMAMFDRWNSGRPGPSGIDNMTMLWLPLIPPATNATPAFTPGTPLIVDTCAAGPAQAWRFAGGELVHAASGLCVSGEGSGISVALAACGAGGGALSWVPTAAGIVENGMSGADCLALNVLDDVTHEPGNPVVSYACGEPTSWNEIWSLPSGTGPLVAHDKSGAVSNLCLSAGAPSLSWTLPYLQAWSLKDF